MKPPKNMDDFFANLAEMHQDLNPYPTTKKSGWGGVATAGLGIIGNIISTAMTNRANREMQAETNAQNERLWREQMEYNSPVNQIQRLRQAKLNPNLAYGDTGNAGAPPEYVSSKNQSPQFDPMAIANAMMLDKQMQQVDADVSLKDAEARNLNADAEHQEILNSDARDKIEREKQTWQSNLNEAKARIDKYYSDIGVNLYIKDNKDADTALKRLEHFFKFNTMGHDEEYKRSLNQVNWSKIARDAQEISLMIKKGEEIDVNIASRILHDYIDLGSDPYSADIGNVLYGSLVHGYEYDDATLERVIHAINEDEMKRHNAWKLVGLSAFSPLLNGFDRDLNVFTEKASKGKVNKEDLKKVIEALKKVPVKGKTFKGGPLKTLM